MAEKIVLGVSKCLLGEKVRYDGGHKLDRYVTEVLGDHFSFVPVCPEVEYGLPIPRESLRLTGDPEHPRLVTAKSGIDHTEGMQRWAEDRLDQLAGESLSGFIFKSRSPSSGMQGVRVYGNSGIPVKKGVGIFTRAFRARFPLIPAEDEGRLNDPAIKENFLERVFVFHRWQEFLKGGGSSRGLVSFHTGHKLLILSHSTEHYSKLGRFVADATTQGEGALATYITLLMDGLRLMATAKKHTNTLHHIMGYFKKQLTSDEKEELLEVIGRFYSGLFPLIVPVTLLKHYVRKYDVSYLKGQYYLDPHPVELMLRNHV
jgi:uncharacterized protein YbgA (DUF1722 family)/uncharacterized protein YbbK (DUF523 family)